MTLGLAKRIAARLNALGVPGCYAESALGGIISRWTTNGGRLLVVDEDGGKWVACDRAKYRVWVGDEKRREK